jgi:Uma2 family endonuclease
MTATMADAMTMADVLEQLGDIPPARVRMRPSPGEATEADVLAIRERERRLYELVDGILVEKAMGFAESFIAAVLLKFLGNYLDKNDLGIVSGEAGTLRLAAGLVRIPDVAFISWNRLPGRKVPRTPIPSLVPDLTVEVLSPSNTPREMTRKIGEYFDAGVLLVWLIDPAARVVTVFTSPRQSCVLNEADTLGGGEVLPGFVLVLRDFFGQLDRSGSVSSD